MPIQQSTKYGWFVSLKSISFNADRVTSIGYDGTICYNGVPNYNLYGPFKTKLEAIKFNRDLNNKENFAEYAI